MLLNDTDTGEQQDKAALSKLPRINVSNQNHREYRDKFGGSGIIPFDITSMTYEEYRHR